MNYTETTPSYNERRYGKPWMAILTTSTTKDFSWLQWEGRPGCSGEFSFSAEPGTLLAYGQKDIRKGKGGVDGYQICMPDGTLPVISDETARAANKLPIGKRVGYVAAHKHNYWSTRTSPEQDKELRYWQAFLEA